MIISELLTLLVITSPVRANPATDVIDQVVGSFPKINGLSDCPRYIICDGYRISHKDCFKAGKITSESAKDYEEYKIKLKQRVDDMHSDPTSPWHNMGIVEMDHHVGFSFSVKHALQSVVETPYIFLLQHDRPFLQDFNLELCLQTMENFPEIQYLGLKTPKTRHLRGGTGRRSRCEGTLFTKGELQVYQLWFWYDSNHICRTSKYQELFDQQYEDYIRNESEEFVQSVFPHIQELAKNGRGHEVSPEEVVRLRYRPVIRKQEFFEDTYGQLMKKHLPHALATGGIDRAEEVHAMYGAYLLCSDGQDIVCHYDGRKYRTDEQTQEIISFNQKHQKYSGRGSRRFLNIVKNSDGEANKSSSSTSDSILNEIDNEYNSPKTSSEQEFNAKCQISGNEVEHDIHIKSIWQEYTHSNNDNN